MERNTGGNVTSRYELWRHCVSQRVDNMNELECKLIETAAEIFQQTPSAKQDEEYEVRCIGAIVAMIELTRSVVSGEPFVVKA